MDAEQEKLIMDVANKLKELNELDALEQLIKDNKNEFLFKEEHYRVRKPNSIEREIANKERMKKYIEMLKDPSYLFRKDLITLYKSKNIDINQIDIDMKNLYFQETNLLNRLYGNEVPKEIESLEKDIEANRTKQSELIFYKDDLLKYCIEQKIDDFLKMYFLFLVLEVNKNGKWERALKSYDDFLASIDDMLLAKASQIFAVINHNETL